MYLVESVAARSSQTRPHCGGSQDRTRRKILRGGDVDGGDGGGGGEAARKFRGAVIYLRARGGDDRKFPRRGKARTGAPRGPRRIIHSGDSPRGLIERP